jgi:hypothetical protein
MNTHYLRDRTHLLVRVIGCVVSLSLFSSPACAQSLKELLESDAIRAVERPPQDTRPSAQKAPRKEDRLPKTNYESLWVSKNPTALLLQWIGAQIPGFTVGRPFGSTKGEYTGVRVQLTDKERVPIELSIQVPKPQYVTMAEHHALVSFNRYRPPLLDVVAEQTVPIQGLEAKYYRARDGACSVVFEIEKFCLVNLRTPKCSDSTVMMQVAKALNFQRLNQKLAS